MAESTYPKLAVLLGGYLHQDWSLEHKTLDEAIHSFAAEEPPATVAQARREIVAVLQLPLNDNELADLVTDRLGSSYDPRLDGLTTRDWLADVQRLLSKEQS